MKKATYHKPQMEVIELTTSHMLSASISINNNKVSTGGRAQDKKENSWGNIWEDDTNHD